MRSEGARNPYPRTVVIGSGLAAARRPRTTTELINRISYDITLKRDRAGQWSIRINDQWRICFRWTQIGAEAVEIVDYHD